MKNKFSELINGLTDKELLLHLYFTQIILFIISLILGMILFVEFPFKDLMNWNDPNILYFGVTAGAAVVILDAIMIRWLPPSYYDDGGLNKKIFKNRNIIHIAFIAAVVSISEELLFRGIIQTKVGIILASMIFAIIHYRYLFNRFLFINIVSLSFFIGFIYEWTNNLAVTIVMHFIIDFLLGVMIKKNQLN
jgi:uncharacterized protein